MVPRVITIHKPPTNGTDTSGEAAWRVAADTHTQRTRILVFVRSRGAIGATDQEIEHALGLPGNTVRPRRGELQQAGHLDLTEMRRPTPSGSPARVYVAVVVEGVP